MQGISRVIYILAILVFVYIVIPLLVFSISLIIGYYIVKKILRSKSFKRVLAKGAAGLERIQRRYGYGNG